jgi:hypothetical protein
MLYKKIIAFRVEVAHTRWLRSAQTSFANFVKNSKIWFYTTEGIEAMGALFNWIGELARWLFQTKVRPAASFTETVQGTRKLPCIRIKNSSSEYDIEVKGVCVKPEVYFLTEDMGVRTLIEGASGQRLTFMLRPQQDGLHPVWMTRS